MDCCVTVAGLLWTSLTVAINLQGKEEMNIPLNKCRSSETVTVDPDEFDVLFVGGEVC